MKKLVILTLISLFSITTFAQEKQKEVGTVFNSLNQFGLTYRVGNTNSMWRITTIAALNNSNNSKSDSSNRDSSGLTISLKLGKEFRKSVTNQLEFRYGFDVDYSYYSFKNESHSYYYDWEYENGNIVSSTIVERSEKYTATIHSVGIQLVLGVNYVVKEKLIFGIEINPAFMYKFGENTRKNYSSDNQIQEFLGVPAYNANYEETLDISEYQWGFSNGVGQISILYRF